MERIPPDELNQIVNEIAAGLGETEPFPIKQIKRIVLVCGIPFARELYEATMAIEAEGGMMLPDNSRRRTTGGIYYHLARTKLSDEQRKLIFPPPKRNKDKNQGKIVSKPLISWVGRIALIQSLLSEQGEIRSMKVTLVGRPGRIAKRPEVVVTTMSYAIKGANLPKGIPTPPDTPTLYTIYMSPKQWAKIEKAIADPSDNLLVEGLCTFDPQTNSMAVFASLVRSEHLDLEAKQNAAKKPASPANAPAEKALAAEVATPSSDLPTPKVVSSTPPKKSRIAAMTAEPVAAPVVPVNPDLPPDAARKMSELQASAVLFRQKVATIQGKPAGQQFGLEMTQKLLKNVEDEIAALEKKHAK